MDPRKKRPAVALVAVTLAALALVAWTAGRGRDQEHGRPGAIGPRGAEKIDAGAQAIEEAFRARASGNSVEVGGVVKQLMPDERVGGQEGEPEGGRRQRFVLELTSGRTVMVAHDIDTSPRVPLVLGDRVEVCGLYAWNNRGGVIDRTQRQPEGSGPGGYVRHAGQLYE